VSTQVVDAKPIADRQIPEPMSRVVVDSHVDEGHQRAVGCAYAQRAVPGTAQLHRSFDDAMQRHVEIQVRTDCDDAPYQLFHLITGGYQLIELVVHPADQLAPALPGECGPAPVTVHGCKG
jgi:hypothetical protein